MYSLVVFSVRVCCYIDQKMSTTGIRPKKNIMFYSVCASFAQKSQNPSRNKGFGDKRFFANGFGRFLRGNLCFSKFVACAHVWSWFLRYLRVVEMCPPVCPKCARLSARVYSCSGRLAISCCGAFVLHRRKKIKTGAKRRTRFSL